MAQLLKKLLYDLRQRTHSAEVLLGTDPQPPLPSIAEQYRLRILGMLSDAQDEIEFLLDGPESPNPDDAHRYFQDYKSLSQLVNMIEWGALPAIRQFSFPDDAVMCLMMERICQEIRYPFPTPFCVAGGYSHYLMSLGMDLILAPSMEPHHLLGLPDLYHELGHIISIFEANILITPFVNEIDQHFTQEIHFAIQSQMPQSHVNDIQILQTYWETWLEEFVADSIATYLLGPAYGWANIRLCINISKNIFESIETHPADDARTRLIELVLNSMGHNTESALIREAWDELVQLDQKPRPEQLDVDFPTNLLAKLADFTIAGCRSLGLQPYEPPNVFPQFHVASLLNQAWTQFTNNPSHYASWEASQIIKLKLEFGV